MKKELPLLETDLSKPALIEPDHVYKKKSVPEICIFPFYLQVIQDLVNQGILHDVAHDTSLVVDPIHLYQFTLQKEHIAVMTPGLGGPYAAACLEFAIACGCKKFLAIGSCGVLDSTIAKNQLILPISAIRDEGTSYHYVLPDREIIQDPKLFERISTSLQKKGIKHTHGKTWTTDALFRETPQKIALRKSEGAIAVEMEAASLMAVAEFRKVQLGYILAGGDDVGGLKWDSRDHMDLGDIGHKLFWMAADLCLSIFRE